jgi:hypothetical protein
MVTDMIAKGELDMTEAVVNQRSSEEDADYRTAYQCARTVAVNGGHG